LTGAALRADVWPERGLTRGFAGFAVCVARRSAVNLPLFPPELAIPRTLTSACVLGQNFDHYAAVFATLATKLLPQSR
jgi:hypothetical protein